MKLKHTLNNYWNDLQGFKGKFNKFHLYQKVSTTTPPVNLPLQLTSLEGQFDKVIPLNTSDL